jgi:hypothetical protein
MALGGASLQAVLEQAGLGVSGTQTGFSTTAITEASGTVTSLGVFGKRKTKAAELASGSGKQSADDSTRMPEEKKARANDAADGAEVISGAVTPATQSPPKQEGNAEGSTVI